MVGYLTSFVHLFQIKMRLALFQVALSVFYILFSFYQLHFELSDFIDVIFFILLFHFTAYETLPIPIDSFQGLELCSPSLVGPTSPYDGMDCGEIDAGELLDSMPSPPAGENQAAAWYDTDL